MESNVFKEIVVVKRSGQRVGFNSNKIALAIKNAFDSLNMSYSEYDINKVFGAVLKFIEENFSDRKTINVEDIQDIIEEKLKENNYDAVYEAFNSYRLRRTASREVFNKRQQHKFVKAIEKLGLQTDMYPYDRPIKIMHEFSKTVSKEFAKAYLLDNKYVRAHDEGIMFIHNLSSYPLYTTSMAHLNFSFIKDKQIYMCMYEIFKIILDCKSEQTGEHSINELDKLLVNPCLYTFKLIYERNLFNYLKLNGFYECLDIEHIRACIQKINSIDFQNDIFEESKINDKIAILFTSAKDDSIKELNNILFDTFLEFIKMLDNINSIINNNKVSISLSCDSNSISKLIRSNYLNALSNLNELRSVTTIYKINDIDYISNEVLNLIYHNKNICISFDTATAAEYFSTGEKIYSNVNDNNFQSNGRCVISTTTINLARIGVLNQSKEISNFYDELKNTLDFVKNQLIQRFEMQANKFKKSFPALFEHNLLPDSERLEENQKIRKVLKNGVLNIGLVGLPECVNFLPEKDKSKLMKDILMFINDRVAEYSIDNKLNFIVSQTENKEVIRNLFTIDKSIYGTNYFKGDTYSLLNNINKKDLNKDYHNLQNLINMRINIYLNEDARKEDILNVIKKAKDCGIIFFKIIRGKNEN